MYKGSRLAIAPGRIHFATAGGDLALCLHYSGLAYRARGSALVVVNRFYCQGDHDQSLQRLDLERRNQGPNSCRLILNDYHRTASSTWLGVPGSASTCGKVREILQLRDCNPVIMGKGHGDDR